MQKQIETEKSANEVDKSLSKVFFRSLVMVIPAFFIGIFGFAINEPDNYSSKMSVMEVSLLVLLIAAATHIVLASAVKRYNETARAALIVYAVIGVIFSVLAMLVMMFFLSLMASRGGEAAGGFTPLLFIIISLYAWGYAWIFLTLRKPAVKKRFQHENQQKA